MLRDNTTGIDYDDDNEDDHDDDHEYYDKDNHDNTLRMLKDHGEIQ